MELELTEMSLVDSVEGILIQKSEIALRLVVVLVVILGLLDEAECLECVEYDV